MRTVDGELHRHGLIHYSTPLALGVARPESGPALGGRFSRNVIKNVQRFRSKITGADMRRLTLVCLGFLVLPAFTPAQQAPKPDAWAPYRFLVGNWTAEGHGEPGKGEGAFSFQLELRDKVLVRRNHLDFAATPQRPAFTHEDLLVVYRDSGAAPTRAIYFDSEGFVIHYTAAFSQDGKVLTFLSNADPQAPRQRLTYVQNEDGTLKVKFELAPPGKPEAFVTHVEGIAHRDTKP